jgi:phosphoribosylanthranilate isomerase
VTLVKICGVTLADDAARVAAAGADFLGLNFWGKSKRHVEVERASLLAGVARGASPAVKIVGVFVHPSLAEVREAVEAAAIDVVQLHGEHDSPDFVRDIVTATSRPVWRAFTLGAAGDLDAIEEFHTEARVEAILLDAPAATHRHALGNPTTRHVIDFALAAAARVRLEEVHLVMAGGLGPDNVAAAIAAARPWCVDVASGVESAPGVKDPAKVSAFIAAARAAAVV